MTEPASRSDVLEEVDALIARLESHPDPVVREAVERLLAGIDAIHRTALTHLVAALVGMGGDALLNRLTADPAIRLLLMSYDLVAVDRRLQTEEALDPVRGHLHAHGIDVELSDVVGGTVYLRLHGLERSGADPAAVRRDLEEALRAGLLGFQQLELTDRARGAEGGLVAMGRLRRANRPVHRAVCAEEEVGPGTMRSAEIDGIAVLVVNLDGEFHALRNRCGESPLPLEFGTLMGGELLCPWHGCRYDIRTGRRLDGVDERVPVYPAMVKDGQIHVALAVERSSVGGTGG